jgi:hypothetical protein
VIDFGLDDVQEYTHGVTPRLYVRAPSGTSFRLMKTVGSPTVTYARAGEFPGRTLEADVALDADDGKILVEPDDDPTGAIDWLSSPLSPFGSWVAAEQLVTDQTGVKKVVPWGIYRLDEMILHELEGTISIKCSDVFGQIGDRKLVTLAMGRIKRTDLIKTVMTRMINDTIGGGGIRSWWGSMFTLDTDITDRTYGGLNGKQFRDDRLEALAELGINLVSPNDVEKLAGGGLYSPRTTGPLTGWTSSGPAVKLIRRRNPARGRPEISVVRNLVYGQLDDQVNRADLFNEIVALWQASKIIDGSHTRTIQRRYLAQYNDAGEELRGSGPFGWVSQDAVSIDIPESVAPGGEDTYALQQAQMAVQNKLYATRDLTVQCGPIYGLEQSDNLLLMIQEETMDSLSCEVIGATIPLGAEGGPWELKLRSTQLIDTWFPKYRKQPDDSSEVDGSFKWKTYEPNNGVTVDLNNGHGSNAAGGGRSWRGWTFTGANAAKTKGGSSLTVTSTAGTVTLQTGLGWRVNQGHYRLRGWASVMAVTDGQQFQVGILDDLGGATWGDWQTIRKDTKKSKVVVVEAPVPAAPAASFRLVINVSSMIAGGQARILQAGVNYGQLKKG